MAHKRSYSHNQRTLDSQPDSAKRGWINKAEEVIEDKWFHIHDKAVKAAQEVLQKEYPNIVDKLKHEYLAPEVAQLLKPEMQDHMDRLAKTHVEILLKDYIDEQKKSINQDMYKFKDYIDNREKYVDQQTSSFKNYIDKQSSTNREIHHILVKGLESAFSSAGDSLHHSSENIAAMFASNHDIM